MARPKKIETMETVSVRLPKAMVEEIGDRDLVALARERLARRDTAVEVNIDEI